MKVYSISKWTFRGICLLILLLPVSRHWRLLTSGERTTGTVTRYVERREDPRYPAEASEIQFMVDGRMHKAYGPANYEYKQGRTLTIFYERKNPSHYCVATFSGFYLNAYSILPLILITVWYAFYLSFNNYRRRMKMHSGRAARTTGSTSATRPTLHS